MTAQAPLPRVLACFAGIYIIWGTTFLAITFVLRSMPPFIAGGARFITAGLLMYLWLRLRDPRPFAGIGIAGGALCGVLMSGFGNGLVVWSQQGLPSGIAALFVGAMPVIILLEDWLFFTRRRPQLQAIIGVAVGFAGVAVLSAHTRSLSGTARPVYVAAVFVAGIAWGFGTLLQRRFVPADRVQGFTSLQMFAGGVAQLLLGFPDGEWSHFHPGRIGMPSLLALAYLVAFGSIVAVNCYSWLVAHVPAQKVATYALVNPLIALVLGTLVLGERVTPVAILSAALVLLGVGLVLYRRPGAVPSAAAGAERLPRPRAAGIKRGSPEPFDG
jgi:drug/metabolite transporter (DMT)-like permease